MGMVVRTNVMAMNANRQLAVNNSSVGKSLEKLSSGFRINRAADDASGLAISEKMKAQIKGLEQASANSQDGISLIQTAEGATTEIHNMLNRMVELATKSANGTIQNDVDRDAIQQEVDDLNAEITRIAQSTNFNGINLLDGNLSIAGAGTTTSKTAGLEMSDAAKVGGALIQNQAVAGKTVLASVDGALAAGKEGSIALEYLDDKGEYQTLTVNYKNASAAGDGNIMVKIGDGEWTDSGITTGAGDGTATKTEVNQALAASLQKSELGNTFKIESSNTNADLTFTVKEAGVTKAKILSAGVNKDIASTTVATVNGTQTKGTDAYNTLDVTELKAWSKENSGADTDLTTNKDLSMVTIDGKKFAFVNKGELDAAKEFFGEDVTLIENGSGGGAAGDAIDAADGTEFAKAVNIKLGYTALTDKATPDGQLALMPTESKLVGAGQGLKLQVGDTNQEFNHVTVSVDDLTAKGIGTANLKVDNQLVAGDSIKTIKEAINKVSTNRANLGSLQNRLEYTINNLDTTAENMTAANSRIRDTDMAKEMMNYTKMNILTQSAQAMLAQANQQPQAILQLLQ